jgi:hypothetical protein
MPITIDYTTIDFDALKDELITYLQETQTFQDVQYASSNINTLTSLYAYLGSLFGFYINAIANEPFLPSAKRYKNLNRIARLLSYNPRGYQAASANVVGSLLPEYCFGKKNVYFEIPAYSIFPSSTPTPNAQNFSFTNPDLINYSVKAYGVRPVQISDFQYAGLSLPITEPAAYWVGSPSSTATSGTVSFDPAKIVLALSNTSPLSILDRLDQSNFHEFDISEVPLFDPSDPSSVGQPFTMSIGTNENSLRIQPGVVYYVVFNYDTNSTTPYLTLMEEGDRLDARIDDVITSIRLDQQDANGQFYTLNEVQNNAAGKFYVGVLGMTNLDSCSFSFVPLQSTTNGIQQINLNINKSGDQPPFYVLVDGVVYTFSSGTISSQVFTANSWDVNQPFYNINLNIVTPDAPQFNYDATLTVTSDAPGTNEVTIAQIYPTFTDPTSNISAIARQPGQRFGNFQVIPPVNVEATEQKTGTVNFPDGVTSIVVTFGTPFTAGSPTDDTDYIIELTPSDNVQVWYSNKNLTGFTINIEQDTGFTGNINWFATSFNSTATRTITVPFTTPIPQINEQNPDYTIFLTPSDDVTVWYTNKTPNGFDINVDKDFTGTVSYSTFVFSQDQAVVAETNVSTEERGTATLSSQTLSVNITFNNPFVDNTYGLHMVANQALNTWYTNKSTTGFTINIENTAVGQVNVDWYADYSPLYQFQKHGMIDFSGQITTAGTLPGLRFVNIPETFLIDNLLQGSILFSYINQNGTIDPANNQLNLQYAADRSDINTIKVQVQQSSISYSNMRVFVKNSAGNWVEWMDGSSLIQSVDVSVGELVFFSRYNEYEQVEISFGDGINFGTDPSGNEIIIFGLQTVGADGNVPPNTIGPSIVLSEYILGDTNVTVQFESQFIQLVGLKSQTFFAANTPTSPTSLYDSEGTEITQTELTVLQLTPAVGGNVPETVEELRTNAGSANLRQNRVVSQNDLVAFCNEAFSNYIIQVQVLTYKEIAESGLLLPGQLAQYFFNYLFIVALPAFGNEITTDQQNFILNTLRTMSNSMLTVEYAIIQATLVPIDVRVRIVLTPTGNAGAIQSSVQQAIQAWFAPANHTMGELVTYGPLESIVLNTVGVANAELAFNTNINNELSVNDYTTAVVSNPPSQTVADVKRQAVLQLLAKDPALFNIINPLFSVTDSTTNVTTYPFSADIQLSRFQFPTAGNIIVEFGAT